MVETGEVPITEKPFINNLRKKANDFWQWMRRILGKDLKPPREKRVTRSLATEERQRIIMTKILENLRKKGALLSKEESFSVFEKDWGVSAYSTPEAWLACPGGRILKDENGEPRVALNPYLGNFPLDYQLLTVLEEAIHWSQLRKGRKITWQEELEAVDKLLRLSDYLGLSEERENYLKRVREGRAKEVEKSWDQKPTGV